MILKSSSFYADFTKKSLCAEGCLESTMFKDFQRRLQRDTKKIVDARVHASSMRHSSELKAQPVEVEVVSHPIQIYVVWFGGSVLATTPEFFYGILYLLTGCLQ